MRQPLILACLLALAASASAARAAWLVSDLTFRDYLDEPVTAVAPAGASDLWAVSRYAYETAEERVRWNTQAWRSLNGGLLWDLPWDAPLRLAPGSAPFQDVELFAAAFADRDTGWLAGWERPESEPSEPPGSFVFLRTTDRGRTWTASTFPNGAETPGDAVFAMDAADGAGALAVQGRRVFETTDGISWREREGTWPTMLALQARGLPAPRVAGADAGRAVTGTLTPSGFAADLTAPGTFRAVRFADASHGWVAGADGSDGFVYRTADGGRTWNLVLTAPNTVFHALAAGSPERAWAVAERILSEEDPRGRGVIYGTTDGGQTWSFERIVPGRLVSAAARGPFHAWAGGEDGVYRYVPGHGPPGDLDHDGVVDSPDLSSILRMSGGLEEAGTDDVSSAGSLDIAGAVAVLRGAPGLPSPLPAEPGRRAVVIYNASAPDSDGDGVGDSEQVARHYAAARGVPSEHLLAIRWASTGGFGSSTSPRGNWGDAYRAVILPLRDLLAALGPETVDTLIFMRGVPYSVAVTAPDGTRETIILDSAAQDPFAADEENWSSVNPYAAPFGNVLDRYGRRPFGTGGRPMGQDVVAADGTATRGPYYLVGRVDGPDVETCLAMVDNAVFAERHHGPGGFRGVAYNDNRAGHFNAPSLKPYTLDELRGYEPRYRGYASFDKSIARSILSFEDRGYPWRDEVTYVSLGEPGSRFRDGTPAGSAPRAMFYAGWYNYGRYFNVFEWLPGSVGIDFDSASAARFRLGEYFAGGALKAGLTALVGVLDEPYSYHPKPDALMEYLARGYRLGEAAALATDIPRLARHIVLGDPLYRPFAGPGEPVPVPTLDWSASASVDGWTVRLESDIPVRAILRYATGTDPDAGSPSGTGGPGFFARRHAFAVPAGSDMRAVIEATDATGRVTATPAFSVADGAAQR